MNQITSESKYGFGGRLTKDFPSQVIIDVTEVCNLACIHCPHPDFKKSDRYKGTTLDPELHNRVIDEISQYGKSLTQYVRYTANGEPLTHPKIYDMLDYAVKNSGTFITLTTNAKILNESRVQKLLESGLHMIDISIDAFKEETYKEIRVMGDLNITRKNVNSLIQMKKESKAKTKIIVSFIEQPNNTDEVEDFKNYWESQGVDSVVIRRLHSAAGAVTNIAEKLKKEQIDVKRYPCLYPWERISIAPNGDILFCPQDWLHGSKISNYYETTIREIWQSEKFKSLRDAHLLNNFSNHSFCGKCPDWKQTRWPGEGRSYADLIEEMKQ